MGNVTKVDTNEEFEKILVAMVVSVFHFFKIHREMIFGNTSIIVQDMFRKTPKALNAVNMVFRTLVDHCLRVVDRVMFAKTLERVVTAEGVRVVDRPLSCFLPDNSHQLFLAHMLHDSRVDPSIALQKPKHNAFTLGASSTLPFPSAAKVGFIQLDLTRELLALQFRHMVECFTQALVHSRDRLIVEAQIAAQTVRRLLLVEPLHQRDFFLQLFKRLLFSTTLFPATNVPPLGSTHLERSTENTLFTPQKVGHAPENIVLTICHMGIVVPYGYESH